MNILNFCLYDWGGGGFKLTEAINKHTKHEARHLLIGHPTLGYEYDIHTDPIDPEEILRWVNWADIVHCREFIAPLYIENPNTQWYWLYKELKALGLKIPEKLVVTYVGSKFRNRPGEQHELAKKVNARELVSTVNLLEAWDGTDLNDGPRGPLTWLPNPVPVGDWLKMKTFHDGKPIVCQSPTKRVIRRTDEVLKQIAGKENIEVLIIEGKSWMECMKLKSKADIFLGTFHYPYGWSSLEAMAMKIPVITKLRNDPSGKWPQYEVLVKREVGYLPHFDCPLERLSEGIDALLSDDLLYDEYAELGFRYVKEFHDESVVAKKFISICEEL